MEMQYRRAAFAGLILLLLLFSSSLYAVPITVVSVGADWSDVQGGAGTVNVIGSDPIPGDEEIRWGTPTDAGQSGYRVDAAAVPFTVETGDVFSLGLFTHTNQPIVFDTSITGAQLDIYTDFMIGTTPFSEGAFSFAFTHNETSNGCEPLPVCASDIVSFTGLETSDTFFIDGIEYTLDLVGFSVNGMVFDELSTLERSINTAELLATFRAVPAPPAILLMALGLMGIALSRKPKPSLI